MRLTVACPLAALALLPACAGVGSLPPAQSASSARGLLLAEGVPAADASSRQPTPQPAPAPARAPATAPASTATASDRDAHADDVDHDRDLARMGGWVAIAVGGLAGIVAIGTSIAMLHDKSVRDAGCDANKACSSDALSANADLAGTSPWNTGAYVLAAAGLGIGAFLVITNPSEPETATRIGVSPTASGATVSLHGSF